MIPISERKRIVVKVGTSTLTHRTGRLNIRRVEQLVKTLADLQNAGHEVILVSSGAIGLGMGKLGLMDRPKDTPGKQACAAVGQCELMYLYDNLFSEYSITVAQLLLTKYILLEDRRKNVENALERLISQGVIPVVNENDTVSTYEMQFGDNDTLSAIVTSITKADLLILLSDIDGLYSDDPHDNPDAKLIREVDTLDRKILGMAKSSTGSDVGTGGMATKLTAAKIATYSGADMIIANGGNMGILYDIMNDRYTGTLFHRAKDAEFVLADYIQREMAPTSTGGQ